ncbi:50S ribosomal protein L24 [Helicobacter kayseriensis]|uniref:50S ribosomal protein L24 n=1 Tax=Helicobacter kayseriensis TaxID=2905877 RepID=UPI001E3D3716|nr:50S ribosomal protein L24 [Helicobacter kayseriensis]MCE3048680.1 50S ribosomal protein L24 [Helicobacter kayseriensis]
MVKFKIKKGDIVKVIAGDDKGKSGKVLFVYPKTAQVVVEGCKMVKKAIKPTEENPKGGFVSKEAPMSISNVKKEEQ